EIATSDGVSYFCVTVYKAQESLDTLIEDLESFKGRLLGGLCDTEFGKFGPEYANGAYQARLNFYPASPGRLRITVKAESDWYEFAETTVANQTILHLKSELALLDNFIGDLRKLRAGNSDRAVLNGV